MASKDLSITDPHPSPLTPVDDDELGQLESPLDAEPPAGSVPQRSRSSAEQHFAPVLPDDVDEVHGPLQPSAIVEVPVQPPATSLPPSRPLWLGLALCLAVAIAAGFAAAEINSRGITLGALTLALIFGVLIGNAAPAQTDAFADGITFAKKHLLRIGIVLYGFRLTWSSFEAAGASIFLVDAVVVVTTFLLSMWVGVRWLKLDRETSALIGAGNAICGASAILATAPVVGAKPAQASIAISTVAVFGTIALLLYPVLYRANLGLGWLPGGAYGFGVFIGSTVHEVGQVVAISNAVAAAASDSAVVTKMGRVAMLLPFLFAIAWWRRGGTDADGAPRNWRKSMPLYPLLFAVVVVVNSVAATAGARPMIARLDELALATAMVALGLSTRVTALKEAGPKPLMLAGVLFVWLVVAGGLLNVGLPALARLL